MAAGGNLACHYSFTIVRGFKVSAPGTGQVSVPTRMEPTAGFRTDTMATSHKRNISTLLVAQHESYREQTELCCDPLHLCDPTTMGRHIPGLMNTIHTIFATSGYCNVTERVIVQLVKVTNQILTACRNYLTNHGTKRVWDQAKGEMMKEMEKWKVLDKKNTAACNKAAETVNYLHALEEYYEPLYRVDPTTVGKHMPSLMYTIYMIFATSRHYSVTERVTSLLIKVTNQMVTDSRNYLTNRGTAGVFDQAKREVMRKMEVTDLREAHIDEALISTANTMFLYLPPNAVNLSSNKEIALELEIKSRAAEKDVMELVNKSLNTMDTPTQNPVQFNWLDPEMITKLIGSQTKLTFVEEDAEKFKLALLVESYTWKSLLERHLGVSYKERHISDKQTLLQRKIKDLDDVRLSMACLEYVGENFIVSDPALLDGVRLSMACLEYVGENFIVSDPALLDGVRLSMACLEYVGENFIVSDPALLDDVRLSMACLEYVGGNSIVSDPALLDGVRLSMACLDYARENFIVSDPALLDGVRLSMACLDYARENFIVSDPALLDGVRLSIACLEYVGENFIVSDPALLDDVRLSMACLEYVGENFIVSDPALLDGVRLSMACLEYVGENFIVSDPALLDDVRLSMACLEYVGENFIVSDPALLDDVRLSMACLEYVGENFIVSDPALLDGVRLSMACLEYVGENFIVSDPALLDDVRLSMACLEYVGENFIVSDPALLDGVRLSMACLEYVGENFIVSDPALLDDVRLSMACLEYVGENFIVSDPALLDGVRLSIACLEYVGENFIVSDPALLDDVRLSMACLEYVGENFIVSDPALLDGVRLSMACLEYVGENFIVSDPALLDDVRLSMACLEYVGENFIVSDPALLDDVRLSMACLEYVGENFIVSDPALLDGVRLSMACLEYVGENFIVSDPALLDGVRLSMACLEYVGENFIVSDPALLDDVRLSMACLEYVGENFIVSDPALLDGVRLSMACLEYVGENFIVSDPALLDGVRLSMACLEYVGENFIVSDPALLEIPRQASVSRTVQNHLLSMFYNVEKMQFREKCLDHILAVKSREEDTIQLEECVMSVGGVKNWFGTLVYVHKSFFQGVANVYNNDVQFHVLQIAGKFPSELGMVGIQFRWIRDAEIDLRAAREDRRSVMFETLVKIHLHQSDFFDDLCQLKMKYVNYFEWWKQAPFYFNEGKYYCIANITYVNFTYQNEFLGNTERLVIPPVTYRSYRTLAQSMRMSMGGVRASTGRKGTAKDMEKALEIHVEVFNFYYQMGFHRLGRMFKGVTQSRSWDCLDEFNQRELPVLPVAAEQICTVLVTKMEGVSLFIFSDGDTVSLSPECVIFLTMNPGYAGQELRENININFRMSTKTVSDRHIFNCVKLAICCFTENINLTRKCFTLYKLYEGYLSKEVHYDFAQRNNISVLRTLDAQTRANPSVTEGTFGINVLMNMNLSKLVDEDEPLFVSMTEDSFTEVKLNTSTYKDLPRAVSNSTKELSVISHPEGNLTVIQLYETSLVCHGLMALEPTGTGGTTCALTCCGRPHREMRRNPKAPQMCGRFDVSTTDWTDGIFSTLWCKTLEVKRTNTIWLVLDAVRIENLNLMQDTNNTLDLAEGDRITMAPNCGLLFKTRDFHNASPATVSRMGCNSAPFRTRPPILEDWWRKRSQLVADFLTIMVTSYDDMHALVQVSLKAKIHIVACIYIRQATDVMKGLLDVGEQPCSFPERHLERLFTLMWSIGAVLERVDRVKTEKFVELHVSNMYWPKLRKCEYMVNLDCNWVLWTNLVDLCVFPSDSVSEYSCILVPNFAKLRTAFLRDNVAIRVRPVLLIGEQRTPKTAMAKGYMSRYAPEFHLNKSFNYLSATTSNMLHRIVKSYTGNRVKNIYGPLGGRKITLFVDDMNIAFINEWENEATNESVRQLMRMHGFYSLHGYFTTILDIHLIVAIQVSHANPCGGRNIVHPGFKRKFNIFNCTIISIKSMDNIFDTIGMGYICTECFKPKIVECLPKLVMNHIMCQQTKPRLLPTPVKFNYAFNFEELSRVWEDVLCIRHPGLPDVTTMLKLGTHECQSVIADVFNSDHLPQLFVYHSWSEAPLQTMSRIDIDTVRKVGERPLIMDAILILYLRKILNTQPDPGRQFLIPSWPQSIKIMVDVRFLCNLKNFPNNKIIGNVLDYLTPYFVHSLYMYENTKQTCGNVTDIIHCTISMAECYGVNKEVLPVEANLSVHHAKLDRATKKRNEAQAMLDEKQKEAVQPEFDKAMAENQNVLDEADACKRKMAALINGSARERTEQFTQIKSGIERMVGDVLVPTDPLSYCEPFNREFRVQRHMSWQQELVGTNFSITDCLVGTARGNVSYADLWAEDHGKEENSVASELIVQEIKKEFIKYMDLEKIKLAMLVVSDAWKYLLERHLGVSNKEKLSETVQFISDKQTMLHHTVKDLDDVRLAVACLHVVRENFIHLCFVSDPALLEIRRQACATRAIQSNLLSMFDNVNVEKVQRHDKDYDRILTVKSRDNESNQIEKDVMCFGGVANWFGTLLNVNKPSLQGVIANVAAYLNDADFHVLQMTATFLPQLGIYGTQLLRTRASEIPLGAVGAELIIMKYSNEAILDLPIIHTVEGLSQLDCGIIDPLVTTHLDQREIFDVLCQLMIKYVSDFVGLEQSRFYVDAAKDEYIADITDVNFVYRNEYLGNTATDRHYMALAKSIRMSMEGAPASTGKTVTNKAIEKALEKYMVVFNFLDQIDFHRVGRIFKGDGHGSWGCFDEFHEIELPVLSVATQQIAIVLAAKVERKCWLLFTYTDSVSLSPEFGIFLTMNHGFAGRQDISKYINNTFRSTRMTHPDWQMLFRVKHTICSFIDNTYVARNLFTLYNWYGEYLSKQVNYDFGMRNIYVLRILGDCKEAFGMRVLRDMYFSKHIVKNETYDDTHAFVQVSFKSKLPIVECIYIRQATDVMQDVLDVGEQPCVFPERHLERFFLFTQMWSIGAVLEIDDHGKMQTFVKLQESKINWPKIKEVDTTFEYMVDTEVNWVHWTNLLETYVFASDTVSECSFILVSNFYNVRTALLLDNIAIQDIGEQGTAKTVTIKCYMLRSWAVKFPDLIPDSTTDWFSRLPHDGLVAVFFQHLTPFKMVCATEVEKQVIDVVSAVQDGVVHISIQCVERFRWENHVTPKYFISFLDGFKKIFLEDFENINVRTKQMNISLANVVEADICVGILRQGLEELENEILIAGAKTGEVLAVVSVSVHVVEKGHMQVEIDAIAVDKALAEEQLDVALPALEVALHNSKISDIVTVRKLGELMRQFLILNRPRSLKMIADVRLFYNLHNFPKDKINGNTLDFLTSHLHTYVNANQECGNVTGLVQWTTSRAVWRGVNKEVRPLKVNLVAQQTKLARATNELNAVEPMLHEKKRELMDVQTEFDKAMAEMQDEGDACKKKMDAALAHTNGSARERIRWRQQFTQFKSGIERMVGDVLVPTDPLSYCEPFNREFRVQRHMSWQQELVCTNFSITDCLVDTARGNVSYVYLWAEDHGKEENSVACELIVQEIKKEFAKYMDLEKIKLAMLVVSDAWKYLLERHLGVSNKEKLSETVQFISDKQTMLHHTVKDLDDVRLAVACLHVVRENFIHLCFVSDPALLEIRRQACATRAIQSNLLSMFDNVNVEKVQRHDKDYDRILTVKSRDNESNQIEKDVMCFGGVANWFGTLLNVNKPSLQGVIANVAAYLNDADFHVLQMTATFLPQLGIYGTQLLWTRASEIPLGAVGAELIIMKYSNEAILDLPIIHTVEGLSQLDCGIIDPLVTTHLDQREIFDELCQLMIKYVSDFVGLEQSRFYVDAAKDEYIADITDVNFVYRNEYLGNTATDRHYMALAKSIRMSMEGAPASTGKTVTNKAIEKALEKYMVVFNFLDQIDFHRVGRIFKGDGHGSWGCFDEFHEIELPVLSVATQQIAIVLAAKVERKCWLLFTYTDSVSLSPEFGIFLTMNHGFAGRQDISKYINNTFRSTRMTHPDWQMLFRVKHTICSFIDNTYVARNLFTLYKWYGEYLSKQVNYDFGMRNIYVLRILGDCKEAFGMRVLRDMYFSKHIVKNETYDDTHAFVQVSFKSKLPIVECIYIRQATDVMQDVLDVGEQPCVFPERHLERFFLFTQMWSIGAVLEMDDHGKMQTFVKLQESKINWPKIKEVDTTFEYMVDTEVNWVHWTNLLETYVFASDTVSDCSFILVSNFYNVRTALLLDNIAIQDIGEQGTAKTVTIKCYMLRSWAVKFPDLIPHSTTDWFSRLPHDGLVAVFFQHLTRFKMVCATEVEKQVFDVVSAVQDGVVHISIQCVERFRWENHVTPKYFISFLDGFKKIFLEDFENINVMTKQMNISLAKVVEADICVGILRQGLEELENEILIAGAKTGEVLAVVSVSVHVVEKGLMQVEIDAIAVDKALAEEQLDVALPALEVALHNSKISDIVTVRKLGELMRQFLILNRPRSLKMIADVRLFYNLHNFPKDKINGNTLDFLTSHLHTYVNANQECGNVTGLVQWTTSRAVWHGVNKEVQSLKVNLVAQQTMLARATNELNAVEPMLHEKKRELMDVQTEFDKAMAEMQDEGDACKKKMYAALAHTNGSAGERIRWRQQFTQFKSGIERMVGDVLVPTDPLSYCEPFNREFRVQRHMSWQQELVCTNFSITDCLVDTARGNVSYADLWAEDHGKEENSVASELIVQEIKKEFAKYMDLEKTHLAMLVVSDAWSYLLERHLGVSNKEKFIETVQFISDKQTKDLDDVRLAVACLHVVRENFMHLCFVSDPALLEIRRQACATHAIQSNLLSMFDNVNVEKVQRHDKDYDRILAVKSRDNESNQIEKDVMCFGGVANWFGTLLNVNKPSLQGVIANVAAYLNDADFHVLQMTATFLKQLGLYGTQLLWTRACEIPLGAAGAEQIIMKYSNEAILDLLNIHTVEDLSKLDCSIIETLVTTHLDQREIFDELCQLKIKYVSDFEGLEQSRFYVDAAKDECIADITDVNFVYRNEYLGNTATDRHYMALAKSIRMSMEGAPARTGKTVTNKAIEKALEKYMVVFNFLDQIDFHQLGRIFKGDAHGCFDEFHRIELPVLSVAAQQIAIVLAANVERKCSLLFTYTDTVSLSPEFGIFLTMNQGFAGRQDISKYMNNTFRTTRMTHPDWQMLFRVKHTICSFIDNTYVARNLFTLYKWYGEYLSKQVNYDFGMRNIYVLRILGAQKPTKLTACKEAFGMRVLRGMYFSKHVDRNETYDDTHAFVQVSFKSKIPIVEHIYIRQVTDVMQDVADVGEQPCVFSERHLERFFHFTQMWSIGAVLELDDHGKMQTFVKLQESKINWPKIKEVDTIFEYMVNTEGNWVHWTHFLETYVFASDTVSECSFILVSNFYNVRTPLLLDNIAIQDIGEQGTAKTVMIKCYMLRSRAVKFTDLVPDSTTNWFSRLPHDGLVAVFFQHLTTFKMVCATEVEKQVIDVVIAVQDGVVHICIQCFERFRWENHVTPKYFISFLDGFKKIFLEDFDNINVRTKQMNISLANVVEADICVGILRQGLEELENEILIAGAKTGEVLAVVSVSVHVVEKGHMQVEIDAIVVNKALAEEQLDAALPALEAAKAALHNSKSSDLATVRKLGEPSYLKRQFLILNRPKSLKMIVDVRLFYNLHHFPKDKINGNTFDFLTSHLYTYVNANQECGNVTGLVQWAISRAVWHGVNKEVRSLKVNLVAQQTKLARATNELNAVEPMLHEKKRELMDVQTEFDKAMAEMQVRIRWTRQFTQLKSGIERMVGDVLVPTGPLSYCEPFNREFRVQRHMSWQQELVGTNFSITDCVVDTARGNVSYVDLWAEDHGKEENSVASELIVQEIKKEFAKYMDLETTKLAMLVVSDAWNYLLERHLGVSNKEKLRETVQFISDKQTMLHHTVKDLDDVRLAVACLHVVRENFMHLFFVSDPALLEIRRQACATHAIQSNLLSMFDNVNVEKVQRHDKDYDRILTVKSRDNESNQIEKDVMCFGGVANWFGTLLNVNKPSLQGGIANVAAYLNDADFHVLQMTATFLPQLGIYGTQLLWTRASEIPLGAVGAELIIMKYSNEAILDLQIIHTVEDLSKLDCGIIDPLVTTHLHQREIFDELCQLKIKYVSDFERLEQSHLYVDAAKDECIADITDLNVFYRNEYLGNTATDRHYMGLAKFIRMSMEGAPASTGKTVTNKAIEKALEKYMLVFNFLDQIDFHQLGRIFKGDAHGSWGCFDEFHRIVFPILSAATQQIAIVLAAKVERKCSLLFTYTDTVCLSPEFGIFLTMNHGFAGQDISKYMNNTFRTTRMTYPDWQMLFRVKHTICSFIGNTYVARNLFTLYKWYGEYLSKQVNYDFALRNIYVLRILGAQKRTKLTDCKEAFGMRVLRGMYFSKHIVKNDTYDDTHAFVQLSLKSKMPVVEHIYIRQATDVMQDVADVGEQPCVFSERHLERFFLFTQMWSIGAVLELDDHGKMKTFVKHQESKINWSKIKEVDTIFEYMVNTQVNWVHWTNLLETYVFASDTVPECSIILVSNFYNVHTALLLDNIAIQDIGEQGTAKTVMIKCYMLRSRAVKFPDLIPDSTTDWFSRLPHDGLVAVFFQHLTTFKMVCATEVEKQVIDVVIAVQDGVVHICIQCFERFRWENHVTPKYFISFLDGFKKIFLEDFDNINVMTKQMNISLAKVVEADICVGILRQGLEELENEILIAGAKTGEVLAVVSVSVHVVEEGHMQVEIDAIAVDKALVEEQLDAAVLALEVALHNSKSSDIATVRKLGEPSYLKRQFLILNRPKSLKMIANVRLFYNLHNFPKDKINGNTLDFLTSHLDTYVNANQECGNVTGLVQWAISRAVWHGVNKEVRSLKVKLVAQQTKLARATKELNAVEPMLHEKKRELMDVRTEFDKAMAEMQIGEWYLQSLHNDDLSIQNGIIVTKAPRFPLMVGPQNQDKEWMRNMENVTSLHHMEDCLSIGQPMLTEELDNVPGSSCKSATRILKMLLVLFLTLLCEVL